MTTNHPKLPAILECFEQISRIPRRSKHEKQIADWLVRWAEEHGFPARQDDVLNVVIDVPGTPGYENSPKVVIQGHMDMVCERGANSTHDFDKDPIQVIREGDWLHADDTTLGADNGIAIAMAMVAATSDDVPHPPLELLFTVDEETGLTGANELKPGFLEGRILLNIDSEDEGVLTVGCAGGRDTHIEFPIEREAAPAGQEAWTVTIGGLHGGHSGIDIQKERGNAIRILARALTAVRLEHELRLLEIHGGSAHNAIPRDASATIFLRSADVEQARAILTDLGDELAKEYANTDAGVRIALEAATGADPSGAWSPSCTNRCVDLLLAIPHGVSSWSTDIEGLVETSNNLATVKTESETVSILSSQRSSLMRRLDMITWQVEAAGRLAGADVTSGNGYPAWQANMDSPLLARCKSIYHELFGKDPVVEIIHAGLECGIIGDRYPGMDMISFGPTIQNPHSPNERIQISTIGQVWDLLAALLKSFR